MRWSARSQSARRAPSESDRTDRCVASKPRGERTISVWTFSRGKPAERCSTGGPLSSGPPGPPALSGAGRDESGLRNVQLRDLRYQGRQHAYERGEANHERAEERDGGIRLHEQPPPEGDRRPIMIPAPAALSFIGPEPQLATPDGMNSKRATRLELVTFGLGIRQKPCGLADYGLFRRF